MSDKSPGLLDRLASALQTLRGEDDPGRYNTLRLEAPAAPDPVERMGAEFRALMDSDPEFKAATRGARFDGAGGGIGGSFERHFQSVFGRYMGSRVDYAKEVGDPTQSSLVMAAVNFLGIALPEAPLQVVERAASGGRPNVVEGHELAELLERPNPYYPGELLWMAFALSWIVDGNVYWWKIRNGLGKVIQLWPIPHTMIEPRWPAGDDSTFISHYAYLCNGRELHIPPEDIVHFRRGVDPANPRKGLSPLASLLREIFGDNEAANASALLMKNCGVFPFVISPKADVGTVDVDPQKLKDELVRRITGDERGKPIVQTVGVEIQKLAFSPKELEMKELRRLPEERVAAVLGIPAIVLNFGAGLDRSTFANYAEAREAAYESHVVPTWRIIAGHLNLQLLPDFKPRPAERVRHDLSGVRVLQDDLNKLFVRLNVAYNGGWMRRSEARFAAGLPVQPEDVKYKIELSPQAGTAEPAPEETS
jgi:HK97 family phage portal protein